jgi:hypothetical protein
MVKNFLDFFFFTAAGLYFGLKNAAVLKSPNSELESIYLATPTHMRVNRSRWFNLFMVLFTFPKGYVFNGSTDKRFPCAIAL